MGRNICNVVQMSDSQVCKMCDKSWDYGDYDPDQCPNKGRKKLDVAFEKLMPYFELLNRHKKIYIDVGQLLKKESKK